MAYLLDTSVFSQPLKNRPDPKVLSRWSARPEEELQTSAICVAELLQGLENRGSTVMWRRYRSLLEPFYLVRPFDAEVARTYAQLHARLRTAGKPRPAMDLLIGATAVHHGLVLATLNSKDFEDIPGLTVENWAQ